MKLEDIIEGLNRHIESKRESLGIEPKQGHLILQKTIKPHNIFKAYKECNFTIWFVRGRNKFVVLTLNYTGKIISGQEEGIMRDIIIRLSEMIFNWIGSDFYEQVVKGEYNGYTDE